MEPNQEMLELLRKMERSSRRGAVINGLICLLLAVTAVSGIAMCLALYSLAPRVDGILGQLETVLTSLEQTSSELAALELDTMVRNVDALAVYAQESLAITMEKLERIDFETLNKAIEDLSRVIEPLAKFVGLFG